MLFIFPTSLDSQMTSLDRMVVHESTQVLPHLNARMKFVINSGTHMYRYTNNSLFIFPHSKFFLEQKETSGERGREICTSHETTGMSTGVKVFGAETTQNQSFEEQ